MSRPFRHTYVSYYGNHKVRRRLITKIVGEEIPTLSVKLTFSSSTLPRFVRLGYTRYNVNAHVYPEIQCLCCREFNHYAKSIVSANHMQAQLLVFLLLFPQPILFRSYHLAWPVYTLFCLMWWLCLFPEIPPTASEPLSHPDELVSFTIQTDVCEPFTTTDGTHNMERLVMFFIRFLSMLSQGSLILSMSFCPQEIRLGMDILLSTFEIHSSEPLDSVPDFPESGGTRMLGTGFEWTKLPPSSTLVVQGRPRSKSPKNRKLSFLLV